MPNFDVNPSNLTPEEFRKMLEEMKKQVFQAQYWTPFGRQDPIHTYSAGSPDTDKTVEFTVKNMLHTEPEKDTVLDVEFLNRNFPNNIVRNPQSADGTEQKVDIYVNDYYQAPETTRKLILWMIEHWMNVEAVCEKTGKHPLEITQMMMGRLPYGRSMNILRLLGAAS